MITNLEPINKADKYIGENSDIGTTYYLHKVNKKYRWEPGLQSAHVFNTFDAVLKAINSTYIGGEIFINRVTITK